MTIETNYTEETKYEIPEKESDSWLEFVTTHSPAQYIEKFKSLEATMNKQAEGLTQLRLMNSRYINIITEFIRDGLDENGVDKDDLLKLAANLDLSLIHI